MLREDGTSSALASIASRILARRCSRRELPTRLSYEEPLHRVVTLKREFYP
jgi:hypothetical protein